MDCECRNALWAGKARKGCPLHAVPRSESHRTRRSNAFEIARNHEPVLVDEHRAYGWMRPTNHAKRSPAVTIPVIDRGRASIEGQQPAGCVDLPTIARETSNREIQRVHGHPSVT